MGDKRKVSFKFLQQRKLIFKYILNVSFKNNFRSLMKLNRDDKKRRKKRDILLNMNFKMTCHSLEWAYCISSMPKLAGYIASNGTWFVVILSKTCLVFVIFNYLTWLFWTINVGFVKPSDLM